MCVKLHIEQTQTSKNFRVENEITERGAVIKGQERDKISTKRRQENAINGKQLGVAPEQNLAVFYISLPRGTER